MYMTTSNYNVMRYFFNPKSVALVGISTHANSSSSRPLQYLTHHGFNGKIFLVNPRAPIIDGIQSYHSLSEIGKQVDLVISMVPAAQVLDVAREASGIGVKAFVIFASGFSELGEQGRNVEHTLRDIGGEHGMRILGPNSQGFVYAPSGTWATFTTAADRPLGEADRGGAYVGQSGAIGGVILDRLSDMQLPVMAWCSTGNESDLSVIDVIDALVDDPKISYFVVYLEHLKDGNQFIRVAQKAQQAGKSIILLKSGSSSAGRRAASSHTGAILGSDVTIRAIAARYNIVLAKDISQSILLASLLASSKVPKGKNLGVVTSSGGAGSILADLASEHKFSIPVLEETTQTRLRQLVPTFAVTHNPVDVTAQLFTSESTTFGDVCELVCADRTIDALIIILTNIVGETAIKLATDIVNTDRKLTKPVYIVWPLSRSATAAARQILTRARLPVVDSLVFLMDGLDRIVLSSRDPADPPLDTAPTHEVVGATANQATLEQALLDVERDGGASLLDAMNITRPKGFVATDAASITLNRERVKSPWVMKLLANSLKHKSDVSAVRMNIPPEDATQVFQELMTIGATQGFLDVTGVQVQERIAPGLELMISVQREHDGFPVVACVGRGGVTTEIERDITYGLAPLTRCDALQMLQKLRIWPLFKGYRHGPVYDIEAVIDALINLCNGFAQLPRIGALELNPIIVGTEGAGIAAVDLLVTPGRTC